MTETLNLERFYFYNDETNIIYYSEPIEDMPDDYERLIFLGSSDNPNFKMACAYFVKNNKVKTGYKVKSLSEY